MSWRENLQLDGKGSFRDVEFYVDSAESSVGRRTSLHEFPGSDHIEVEDLGRGTRKFTLVCYVLGAEYMAQRDKLIDAFEKPGPGPLVHPFWGEMVVAVQGEVRIRESVTEGGMARFTLSVYRVTEDFIRVVRPDTAAEVATAADAAVDALAEDFEEEWTFAGVIEAVRDAAQDLIDGVNGVTSTLNKINGYANAAMNLVDSAGDAIDALADEAAELVLLPATLATNIQEIVGDVTGSIAQISTALDTYFTDDEAAGSTAGTPETSPTGSTPASGDQRAEAVMTAFRDSLAYGADFPDIVETTQQRVAEAGNQAAMIALYRGLAAAEACRWIATVPFVSYDLASSVSDELSDAIDGLADVADDITYAALTDLRASITRHLTATAAELPRVMTHTPAKTLPALVIAQQIYADSTRDADIVERNNIRNPCRVPAAVPLEVLSSE